MQITDSKNMQKGDFLYIFKGLNCSYKLLKEPAPCVAADVPNGHIYVKGAHGCINRRIKLPTHKLSTVFRKVKIENN